MPNLRKFLSGPATVLGDREVRVRCSSGAVDRAGEVIVQTGITLAPTVPVLWSHDPEKPVGRAAPQLIAGELYAVITFAPAGISKHVDEVCGLTKSGTISGVSVGFDPISSIPMEAGGGKYGPQKYLSCELLEISLVSIPCNPDAEVVARSQGKSGRVLSAANREKIAAAHDAASTCMDHLAEVLSGAEDDPSGGAGDPSSADAKARRLRRVRALGLALPPASPRSATRVRSRADRLAAVAALESQSYGNDPELWPIYRAAESIGMHMTEGRARQILCEAKQLHRPADHHTRAVFARKGG